MKRLHFAIGKRGEEARSIVTGVQSSKGRIGEALNISVMVRAGRGRQGAF